jgi:hypothetical protein
MGVLMQSRRRKIFVLLVFNGTQLKAFTDFVKILVGLFTFASQQKITESLKEKGMKKRTEFI